MSNLGTSVSARPTTGVDGVPAPGQTLLRAFNELRDELVSTLMFLLGNGEDAQDAAQEAFLKCWRTQDSLSEVNNLRAWIFRVALNTAKDYQRSAWHRRARPLMGEAAMLMDSTVALTWGPPNAKLTMKDTWQLLDRGQVLSIQSVAHSSRGEQKTTLVFERR